MKLVINPDKNRAYIIPNKMAEELRQISEKKDYKVFSKLSKEELDDLIKRDRELHKEMEKYRNFDIFLITGW